MITMYAIPNCETVKKARALLDKKKVSYEFVDFKKMPPKKEWIKRWSEFLAGELPINKKGLTYKKYKNEFELLSPAKKVDFILTHASMIKRPILEKDDNTLAIGFDEEIYSGLKIG